jgi:4-hydroxyphenylpyruvate dioxygenase-like putative hemolysin
LAAFSVQDVKRAIDHAEADSASKYDKDALAYLAGAGKAGKLSRDAAYQLNRANKQS